MKCFIGIDLGSTTTKAVFLDEDENLIGKGITNSRSDYDLACMIARSEAEVSARFNILEENIAKHAKSKELTDEIMLWLDCKYQLAKHKTQLDVLCNECFRTAKKHSDNQEIYEKALTDIFATMDKLALDLFAPSTVARSDFFRDIASSQFMSRAEELSLTDRNISFDRLIGIFDPSILKVENNNFSKNFPKNLEFACEETIKQEKFKSYKEELKKETKTVIDLEFNVVNTIGTGYGRQRLPFPKHQIRSEILCHGLGAHYMFPNTRTVLDIGGQDTKGIQVDENGIVTNFQMNDRCAAGCGRYLGYIADEMNVGVHELGPMAIKSKSPARINSTCTVFAGSELRERLALGEKREDILAGLHRSIILRAMSILARSGGVRDEFTFTGGVAKNQAATNSLIELIEENYGKMKINISPDSIYTGAIGASLFGKRDFKEDLANITLARGKVAAEVR